MIHVLVDPVKSIRSVVAQMLKLSGSVQEIAQTCFNEEQNKAIEHKDGPMLCIGTPGSGKTTVIVNRIARLVKTEGVKPSNILVITFTREAALEMERRYKGMDGISEADGNVRFGTFHSFFFWILRTAYKGSDMTVMPEDERYSVIKKLISEVTDEKDVSDEIVASVIRQLDIISSDMINIADYYSDDLPEDSMRTLYRRFRELKRESGRIDFSDMMDDCYSLLSERPDITERISQMYPYIMVDEFQDTNRIQYEILKLISGRDRNVFVVGDDDQSIYGFRGARPDVLFAFEREYKGCSKVILPVNYRCPEIVVRSAEKLIEKNTKRFSKKLISGNKTKGDIDFIRAKDPGEEARTVVTEIRKSILEGTALSDIAVLYRTNRDPVRLIFRLREYNIPFDVKDGSLDIFSSFAVSVVLDYMAFVTGDRSRGRFLRIMNRPVRYIERNMLTGETVDMERLKLMAKGKEYLKVKLISFSNQIHAMERMNPFAMVNFLRKAVGLNNYFKEYAAERNMDYDEIMDTLDEFQSIAAEFDTVDELFGHIEEYRKLIRDENSRNRREKKDAVSLMTFHGAKGLEWKEVHIIECVEGKIPHRKSKAVSLLEEERRMFYVAVTRTGKKLRLYAPEKSGDREMNISRFIREMQ